MNKYDACVIEYNGRLYSRLGNPAFFKSKVATYSVYDLNNPIENISRVVETDEEIILQFLGLFVKISGETFEVEERVKKEIAFSKAENRIVRGDKFDDADFSYIRNFETTYFVDKIVSTNINVSNYLKSLPKKLFNTVTNSYGGDILVNFYNLCTFNIDGFEKLINSNNTDIIEENIATKGFSISDASKLHQVIGLPKFAVQELTRLGLEPYMFEFKKLAEVLDGNALKIFFEFLDNSKLILKHTEKSLGKYRFENAMHKFFSDCSFILEKKRNYKVTDLLSYLFRQVIYYRDCSEIVFPYQEANFLKDYIEMCENYGLKAEKYPAKIRRAHNLTAKNISFLDGASQEVEQSFKDAVEEYADVERIIKYVPDPKNPSVFTEYAFIVPKNIKDLIQEGNDMHHCVGSYPNKIIDKTARVVFMRLASQKNKSLVTIDIDEDYKLTEAKQAFNAEIDEVQTKVIKKWLKEISK